MNQWLDWAKQLRAIGQAGKTYSQDVYDLERFEQIEHIAESMFADLASTPVEKVHDLFIPETGYPTPKIDLRAAVFRDNQLLLVRERADDGWTLPGGWADVCEPASTGVIREVLEESGYVVDKPRLIAVKDRALHAYRPLYPFHIYKMFFICELIGGEACINHEVSDIGFFAEDDIPQPLSSGRTLMEDIQHAFAHLHDASLPIYLD